MIGDAKAGDVVVNTRTRLAYVIAEVLPEGYYQLAHWNPEKDNPFKQHQPPRVHREDPDYVRIRPTGPVSSPTETYLSTRETDVTPAIEDFKDVKRLLAALIDSEKRRGHNEHVFYNAAGPGARALHRMAKILIQSLHTVLGGTPPSLDSFEFLRAPAREYHPQTLLRPQEFLDTVMSQRMWSDRDEPKPVLSTNLTVLGDIKAGGSENTLTIFFKNGLFDVDEKKALGIFESLLASYRLPGELGQPLLKCVATLQLFLKQTPCNPAIYQIFIDDDVLDEVAYISVQSGYPLDSSIGKMYGLKPKLDHVTSTKLPARSGAFTRSVLNSVGKPWFWEAFSGGNDPQARLIMNPNFFSTPNSSIRIRTFELCSTQLDQELVRFKREVDALCQRYIEACIKRLEEFHAEHATALTKLAINVLPEPSDCSVSILTDMVLSLPAILDRIQGSGMSVFDFINIS